MTTIYLGTYDLETAKKIRKEFNNHQEKLRKLYKEPRKFYMVFRGRGKRTLISFDENGKLVESTFQRDLPLKLSEKVAVYIITRNEVTETDLDVDNISITEDSIEVCDNKGNTVKWTKEEWKIDDNVPLYMAHAIKRVVNGNTLL